MGMEIDNNLSKQISKQPDHQQQETEEKEFQWVFLGDTQFGKKTLEFFQDIYYSIFVSIVTLISLFLDDIRVIFFTAHEDIDFSIINLICIFIFTIEITVFSLCKKNYFLSYYFWLDFVSTLTMVLDLIWISQLLTGGNGVQSAASIAKVARASRASKIGARATKLIRIIRLIRFLKLYKNASKQLIKKAHKHQNNGSKKQMPFKNSKNQKMSAENLDLLCHRSMNKRWTRIKQVSCVNIGQMMKKKNYQVSILNLQGHQGIQGTSRQIAIYNQDKILQSIKQIEKAAKQRKTQNIKELIAYKQYLENFSKSIKKDQSNNAIISSQNSIQVPSQTKVGFKLKDQIQKNIITMILVILISIPLFSVSTWYNTTAIYNQSIYQMEYLAFNSPAAFDSQVNFFIEDMLSHPQTMIYFQIAVNSTCCTFPDNYSAYSVLNQQTYRTEDLTGIITDNNSVIIFQGTSISILSSQLNIGRTLFVCILLIFVTLLFSRDLQTYALQPLEEMFDIIKRISINPLGAIRQIQEKNMTLEVLEDNNEGQIIRYQTQPNILQNLIVKIGGLLAIGFGEAGTQIISKVIEDPNFVNVVIPGQKVMGIFGFCDIRNFTDATEVLEADVMIFVNQIAQICHSIVNSHGGSPNKNIGDAFLLVWKYDEGDIKFQSQKQKQNQHHHKLQLAETKKVKQIADLAVLSFIRMIAEIAKAQNLLKYKNNQGLKARIKNYKGVKMGFGLHVGWAIQGPIGSQYKVDASYLSPNVNMSGRLEAATKQYGVPMLITGQVYNLMTKNKSFLRKIDRVLFQGCDQPSDLYTVDLDINSLLKVHKMKEPQQFTAKQKRLKKVRQNIKRNQLLKNIETSYVTKQMWNEKDIQIMREKYTLMFFQQWKAGFDYYVKGDWEKALECFKNTQSMAPQNYDGPSQCLIKFISSYNGVAPQNWPGYRQIA